MNLGDVWIIMKNYKVGDTVYLKAFVANVDKSDPEKTYGVNFVRGNYVIQAWPDREAIIDELPTAEPVKPVLPKGVADEMEAYKEYGDDFNEYIYNVMAVPDTHYLIKTHDAFIRSNVTVETLLNAWNNGYTIEQEPCYMVYVPGTNKKFLYNKRGDSSTRAAKLETPIVPSPVTSYQTAYSQYKPLYWFTYEEITKFDLQDCEKELVADDSED